MLTATSPSYDRDRGPGGKEDHDKGGEIMTMVTVWLGDDRDRDGDRGHEITHHCCEPLLAVCLDSIWTVFGQQGGDERVGEV
jgi:hypothetical protein